MNTILNYYSSHGKLTDPGDLLSELKQLPDNIQEFAGIVQYNLVHAHWLERYGLTVSEQQKYSEMNIRFVRDRLKDIVEKQSSIALTQAAPLELRSIGTCRDFSVLLCSLLREAGIPARARCGFAACFVPDHFEDHWVCEWWNSKEQRWILTDAQLDDLQCRELYIRFDPLDVPADCFITGGQAWAMCRKENCDPDLFGIFDFKGIDFIKGNFVRDIASLNRVPLLPWDCWGIINKPYTECSQDDLEFLDSLAEIIELGDEGLSVLKEYYETDERLCMTGSVITYFNPGNEGPSEIRISV